MTEHSDDPQLNSNGPEVGGPTAAALEAQARLLAMRAALADAGQLKARADDQARPVAGDRRRLPRVERGGLDVADGAPVAPVMLDQGPRPADVGAALANVANSWAIRNAQRLIEDRRRAEGRRYGAYGPAATGWLIPSSYNGVGRAETAAGGESIAVSAESGPQGRPEGAAGRVAGDGDDLGVAVEVAGALSPRAASVRIAPDLVLFAAQCGDFAPARLYMVAAALDPSGRRLLDLDPLAALITDKRSAWYLYGRRRLAAVLRAGEGVYWQREKGPAGRLRLRLRSRARIVAHYGITLTGHEVIMPAAVLLSDARDHGRAREAAALAAVYASAHAGRRSEGKPISRAKIKAATGLSRWRQRRYERRRGIASRKQIAIDGGFSDHRLASLRHERIASWRHVDRRGLYGPRGAVYIGRQLPNVYRTGSQYARVNSTRQRRRINATARRLSNTRDAGRRPFARVFFDDLRSAGKAASREVGRVDARPVYARQPGRAGRLSPARVGVWRDLARVSYADYLRPAEGVI